MMTNRRARRSAAARARAARVYPELIRHFPRVELGELEPGRTFYIVRGHHAKCAWHRGADCNCSPRIRVHAEPRRS